MMMHVSTNKTKLRAGAWVASTLLILGTGLLVWNHVLPISCILILLTLIIIEAVKIVVILRHFARLHGTDRVLLVTLAELITFGLAVGTLILLANPTVGGNHTKAITCCADFMILRLISCLILWEPLWTADDKKPETEQEG